MGRILNKVSKVLTQGYALQFSCKDFRFPGLLSTFTAGQKLSNENVFHLDVPTGKPVQQIYQGNKPVNSRNCFSSKNFPKQFPLGKPTQDWLTNIPNGTPSFSTCTEESQNYQSFRNIVTSKPYKSKVQQPFSSRLVSAFIREFRSLQSAEEKEKFFEFLHTSFGDNQRALFLTVSHRPGGIKFLVEMRGQLLQMRSACEKKKETGGILKGLLECWFCPGMLELERICWDTTTGQVLERIVASEKVHKVGSWNDLKRRLGPDRRCFSFFSRALPNEPLVVLNVALVSDVSENIQGLLHAPLPKKAPEYGNVPCAIFYSINATQPGLSGIDLGQHLIKEAVRELQGEFGAIPTLATLSPMPKFRSWLRSQLLQMFISNEFSEEFGPRFFTSDECEILSSIQSNMGLKFPEVPDKVLHTLQAQGVLQSNADIDFGLESKGRFQLTAMALYCILERNIPTGSRNIPTGSQNIPTGPRNIPTGSDVPIGFDDLPAKYIDQIKAVLTRLGALYLVNSRGRGGVGALDPVAHFHLRNGAQVMRVNWEGNTSPGGRASSYGLMVNYLYNLDDLESNQRRYMDQEDFVISQHVQNVISRSNNGM